MNSNFLFNLAVYSQIRQVLQVVKFLHVKMKKRVAVISRDWWDRAQFMPIMTELRQHASIFTTHRVSDNCAANVGLCFDLVPQSILGSFPTVIIRILHWLSIYKDDRRRLIYSSLRFGEWTRLLHPNKRFDEGSPSQLQVITLSREHLPSGSVSS